jgi:hypothetical protein
VKEGREKYKRQARGQVRPIGHLHRMLSCQN